MASGRAVKKRAKSVPLSNADHKVAGLGYAEEPSGREFPTLRDIARTKAQIPYPKLTHRTHKAVEQHFKKLLLESVNFWGSYTVYLFFQAG